MGFFYFIIGVIVGVPCSCCCRSSSPFLVALRWAVIALPLIAALLVLIGIIAVAPVVGYGPLIAALLIALWTSDRKRRQPRPVPATAGAEAMDKATGGQLE
jgi:hypothetical protein